MLVTQSHARKANGHLAIYTRTLLHNPILTCSFSVYPNAQALYLILGSMQLYNIIGRTFGINLDHAAPIGLLPASPILVAVFLDPHSPPGFRVAKFTQSSIRCDNSLVLFERVAWLRELQLRWFFFPSLFFKATR